MRLTGDQDTLPLCPRWLRRQLQEAALHGETLNGEALKEALEARQWRESFLADRMRDEILLNQNHDRNGRRSGWSESTACR